jgi:hypothetical protein
MLERFTLRGATGFSTDDTGFFCAPYIVYSTPTFKYIYIYIYIYKEFFKKYIKLSNSIILNPSTHPDSHEKTKLCNIAYRRTCPRERRRRRPRRLKPGKE